MNFMATRAAREHMLRDIETAAQGPLAERPGAIADALSRYVGDPSLLTDLECAECPEHYVRHLLAENAELGYAVVALVWRPGQMSPVHAHHTWCALGVHRGTLTEMYYGLPENAAAEGADTLPEARGSVLLSPGQTSHGPADPGLIHRLANLSCRTAVSVHVYGVAFDDFGSKVNLVYAP